MAQRSCFYDAQMTKWKTLTLLLSPHKSFPTLVAGQLTKVNELGLNSLYVVAQNNKEKVMFEWRVKKFAALSVDELYDFLRERVDIFIVDMNTPYSDLDGKDNHPETYHVMGYDNERLVAYSRIMPPKLGYPSDVLPLIDPNADDVCIGRVIVAKEYRGKQVGNQLMQVSFDATRKIYPENSIFISAQAHLKDYYGKFGFDVVTDTYLEDGCTMLGLRYIPEVVTA